MTLRLNLQNWIFDRVENNEALQLTEWKRFMIEQLGYTKNEVNTFLENEEDRAKKYYKKLKN